MSPQEKKSIRKILTELSSGPYFISRLYRGSKPLFYIVISFILFQLFFTYKGVECFPFIHYGMYSEKIKPKSEYQLISCPGIAQSKLEENYLLDPISSYIRLLKQKDPVAKVIHDRCEKNFILHSFQALLNRQIVNTENKVVKFPNYLKAKINQDLKIKCNYLLVKRLSSSGFIKTNHNIDTIYLMTKK
jgi:hypothetical protein